MVVSGGHARRVERLWEVYNTFMAMDTDGDGMLSQQEFSDNPLVRCHAAMLRCFFQSCHEHSLVKF